MVLLVLAVSTKDPPPQSLRAGRLTLYVLSDRLCGGRNTHITSTTNLSKTPVRFIAPVIAFRHENPLMAVRFVLLASTRLPPICFKDSRETLVKDGQSWITRDLPVLSNPGATKFAIWPEEISMLLANARAPI